MQKLITNTWKIMIKIKIRHILNIVTVQTLHRWAASQKLPVNNFEWIKDTSQFNEHFIKSYNEESDEEHFLEINIKYFEQLHELHNDLSFLH